MAEQSNFKVPSKQIKIILLVSVVVIFGAIGYVTWKPTPPPPKQMSTAQEQIITAMIDAAMNKFPATIIDMDITQKCIESQRALLRASMPDQSDLVINGSSKVSCVCTVNALRNRPELAEIEKDTTGSTTFHQAMDKHPKLTDVILEACSKL